MALSKVSDGKACGTSEMSAELLKAVGKHGIDWLHDILKENIWNRVKIPDGWRKGEMILHKQKGDVMECGSYRGIKLMRHAMKVVGMWWVNGSGRLLTPMLWSVEAIEE